MRRYGPILLLFAALLLMPGACTTRDTAQLEGTELTILKRVRAARALRHVLAAVPTHPELQLARLHREHERSDQAIHAENRMLIEAEAGFRLGSCTAQGTWLHDTDRSGCFFAMGYNLMRLFLLTGVNHERLYADTVRPLKHYLRTTKTATNRWHGW